MKKNFISIRLWDDLSKKEFHIFEDGEMKVFEDSGNVSIKIESTVENLASLVDARQDFQAIEDYYYFWVGCERISEVEFYIKPKKEKVILDFTEDV